ncbi:MAG TPA: phage late control D family protein [Caldithrix sp.]|nr:phage late control D family protein [Caldithrix sp.]
MTEQIREVPDFIIAVNGTNLTVEQRMDVVDLAVSDDISHAGMFTVTMNIWDSNRQEFKWIDEDIFAEGKEVEIKVGYADEVKELITGDITALEPGFHEGDVPTLKIRGYDKLHLSFRGRKSRSFLKMKDSDIAQQIAGELGLRVQADQTSEKHEYVFQNNQSDIEFLLQRARRIRYEVFVKEKTLYFRKANNNAGKHVTLEYGNTLKSFYPRLSTMNQVDEVIVQAWDPMTKKTIQGKAGTGDVVSKMSGSKLGMEISKKVFGKRQISVVDKPIFSNGEALQIAKGKVNDVAVEFIKGEGSAIGNPDIRAGEVIELVRLGERFSGLYYVIASTHVVNQNGYTTKFTVERTAA